MSERSFMAGSLVDFHQEDDPLKSDHKGFVVDNNDPLKLRRVKCIVEGLFEISKESYAALPWCMPVSGETGGSDPGLGNYEVPPLYSVVGVFFPTGDLYAPYYRGWADDNVDTTSSLLFGTDYPNTRGHIDDSGSWVRSNTNKKKVSGANSVPDQDFVPPSNHYYGYSEFFHHSGVLCHTDCEGNIIIDIPKNVIIRIGGHLGIKVSDLIHIHTNKDLGVSVSGATGFKTGSTFGVQAGSNMSLEASNIYENCGITYPTVSSTASAVEPGFSDLGRYKSHLNSLRSAVRNARDVALTNIKAFVSALIGTRSK